MKKTHACALLLVTPLLNGCLTPLLWEGYLDNATTTTEREVPAVRPQRLVRAVRSGDGHYLIEARYTDGSLRRYAFVPTASESWPAAGEQVADAELPWLAGHTGELPLECEGYLPIEVAASDDSGDVEAGWPVLRLCRGRLEFREGHDGFRHVARFPRELGKTIYDEQVTAGDVVLGALVVLVTPITAGLDASLFATIFGLAFI